MPDITPDRLYSATEVGQLIGKHSRTVRRYIKDGRFPNATRLGTQKEHYIPGSDVLAFLKEDSS